VFFSTIGPKIAHKRAGVYAQSTHESDDVAGGSIAFPALDESGIGEVHSCLKEVTFASHLLDTYQRPYWKQGDPPQATK